MLQVVPHIRLSAPRDAPRLRELLAEAVAVNDSPTVVRFAKGSVCEELPAVIEDGVRVGGIGTRVRQDLRAAGVDTALSEIGLPDEFLEHASRKQILERVGLNSERSPANWWRRSSAAACPRHGHLTRLAHRWAGSVRTANPWVVEGVPEYAFGGADPVEVGSDSTHLERVASPEDETQVDIFRCRDDG